MEIKINYDKLFKQYKPIDLMGWKVNNVKNYIYPDHPVHHPDTQEYKDYWFNDILRHSIEGKWIDDEGQWIWLYPKLFWYVNVGIIIGLDKVKKSRTPIRPELRDTEWIMFTYLYCCIGFSGFKGDMEYTCHRLVEKHEKGEEIYDFELKDLKERGTLKYLYKDNDPSKGFKKYVNSWDYLRTPKTKPLGNWLYDNQAKDFVLIGSRGLGKSYSIAVGDFMHEWCTGAVKRWEDIGDINKNKIEMSVGSAKDDKLQEFINKGKYFYDNMPGYWGTGPDRIQAPFYRKTTGSWRVKQKSPIKHSYVGDKEDEVKGSQSEILPVVFTAQNPEAAVGIRPVRNYIEEFGLLENAEEVYSANRNSLSIEGEKFGISVAIGTSGNLKKIKQPKAIMTNPDAYDVFGIPNYWEAPQKNIGLFLPSYYSYANFKDENGNTNIKECMKYIFRERTKQFRLKAYKALESLKIYKPLVPSEMFMTTNQNKFPQAELIEHAQWYENNDVFNKIAAVGELITTSNGIKFKPDLEGKFKPILSYPAEDKNHIQGAVIIYEQPYINEDGHIPDNLYRVLYDPVRLDDRTILKDGVSLCSMLVYKKFQTLDGMVDTIVAEYNGRLPKVNDMHDLCLKFAEYYNATITYESNLPGFKEYARSVNKLNLLEFTPKRTIDKHVYNSSKTWDYGINMQNQFLKLEADNQIIQWLKTVVDTTEDEDGQTHNRQNLNLLMSKRLIEEMINYDSEGNFDGISALRLMAIMRLDDINKPTFDSERKEEHNEIATWLKSELLYN